MSAALMESFDAPMLDYPLDMDVHMQTTVSSPKPWLTEASMEEDPHPIAADIAGASQPLHEDVEIEMDQYYGEDTEYEMADETTYPTGDADLVDVDFFDVSRESESHLAEATTLTPTGPLDVVAGEAVDLGHSVPDDHPATTATPTIEHTGAHVPQPSDATQTSPLQEAALASPSISLVQETSVASHDRAEEVPSTSYAEEAAPSAHAVEDCAATHEAEVVPPSSHDEVDGYAETLEHAEAHNGNLHAESVAVHTVDGLSTTHTPLPTSHLSPTPEEGSSLALVEPAENAVHTHDEHEGAYEEGADPHEISDGIYIEPPPPVLVDLPSSSDQRECCLFNAPDETAGSPYGEAQHVEQTAFNVLLRQHPTLYYDRLSDVFDALRQEEHIQRIAEFVEGEMVVDAYDLQLAISEDNIYAREVSLHDLNVLHDGSDLTGPLRIRLRTITPRFIDRYHSLRDQIARLNFVDETGVAYEGTGETEYHSEAVGSDEVHHGLAPSGDYEYEPAPDAHYEEQAEGEQHYEPEGGPYEEQDHSGDPDGQLEEDSEHVNGPDEQLEASHPTAEVFEYHEVHGEEATALEGENEYDNTTLVDDLDADAGNELDAAAHQATADTGVAGADAHGTEYEEYTEPQDDEGTGDYADAVDETVEGTVPDPKNEGLAEALVSTENPEATGDLVESPEEIDDRQHDDVSAENGNEFDNPDDYDAFADIQEEYAVGSVTDNISPVDQTSIHDRDSDHASTSHHEGTDAAAQIANPQDFSLDDDETWNEDGAFDPDLDEPGADAHDPVEADAVSTESSTLSSKTSTKRTYDEVEADEEEEAHVAPTSPGSKRARVT
ncbi:hypothetical protein BV25DRAFT_1995146 [Artomyces pyxidatus]|uniref:Uncharacterized protein n=1 Tax=Artomyces pyxidatus TaxID=48021 RepID=A0ACB8SLL9_9AGAM|nr:hypothetical protein BV25DRAFT_1995146 [Artomyces pyxidatus]